MDLVLEAGEDFTDSSIWKDNTKTPIPMVDWTAILEIKEALNLTVALTLTQGAGVTLGAADGTVLIEISDTQIDALTFKTGLYTLVLTDTGGTDTMYSRGTVTVL